MNLKPYDVEMLLIAAAIRFGKEVTTHVLPDLTPDKFIYSKTGKLGSYDHRNIWRAIETVYLKEKTEVTIPGILAHIDDSSEDIRIYLQAVAEQLSGRYHIYSPDPETIRMWAEFVDKVGSAYWFLTSARNVGDKLDRFEETINHIDDVDHWINDNVSSFKSSIKPTTGGLEHISGAVERTMELWERQRRGEQLNFMPCGIPCLVNAGLFGAGKLSIVHGMSGSGKSSIVHQGHLGVAIGLLKNDLKGCVAVFSLEMTQEQLINRFAGLLAGFDITKLDQGPDSYSDEDYERLKEWAEFVARLPIYVDHTNMLKTSEMEFGTQGLHVSEYGPVRSASMDYLELFGDDEGDNKEQRLDYVVHQHLYIAREYGIDTTAISQTTYGKEGRTVYPAGPSGTRYSQAIRNAADWIGEVWNPIYMEDAGIKYAQMDGVSNQQITIFVQKNRGGRLGSVVLNWEPEYTRISDFDLNFGISECIVFDHLQDVKRMMDGHSGEIPAIEDTLMGEF